jgi:Alw26I/Eco31I/Esp3I family type II restriction m6 adenine DNA methyltransferase
MPIDEITKRYKEAEKNKIFPFFEWQRKDIFENLIKDLLIDLGYNPDDFYYEDSKGIIEIKIRKDLKVIIYLSSLQEKERFLSNKTCAPFNTCRDPETGKPAYEIAVVTNFDTWFFYFEGKEIYAVSAERLEKEWETIKQLISKEAIESGKYKEFARKLLHKEDNKPLREELNLLRIKIANKILQEKTNIYYLKNQDGSYNNEILNEITTRWITRFVSLKLAEDFGVEINFTLKDIRRSFELLGKTAKPLSGAKVKEETLSNAIRALMSEFERRYNGGIFMYKEGVDYITIPDTAFFDLLDFATGWVFPIEDARIIGFIYERFLGQEIVVEREKDKLEAVLKNIGEARGKRKAGGIYYTPKYIVDYIVENTLGEILKEKKEKMNNAVKKLDCDSFLLSLKEAKSLKVLDPACGSGSFLIKVLAEFKNFYEEVKDKARELEEGIEKLKREKTKGNLLFTDDKEVKELLVKYSKIKKELEEIKFPGTFALTHNIYGVDLDPKAIDITAFTLMVQVYDELKNGARCPTMINENLKVGNSLVSAITPDKRNGFISRAELERFKDDISNLIKLREIEKRIDLLDESGLEKLIVENFEDIVDVYISIKEKYPNAIPTPQQKLLDEWSKRAKKEPIEKTFDVLIRETGLARIFLKELYFERIERIKEKIEFEINKPLIKYFNSQKRVLKDKELDEILADKEKLREELRFVKDRATEISKSQPPKVFNWELEFPEVFFNEDGTLKENPGFDCVVGNPPYELIIGEIYKSLIPYKNVRYSEFSGRKNTFWLFIDVSKGILKQNGRHSFIVPSNLLCDKKTKILREKIFLNAYTYKIISFKESAKVFENVLQSVCVFAYINRNLNSQLDTVNLALGVGMPRIPSEDKFVKRRWDRIINLSPDLSIPLYFSDEIETILLKMKNKEKLSSIIHDIYQGDVNLTNHAFAFTNKETPYPLIRGDQVEAYYIKDWIAAGIKKERFVNISKLRGIIDINKINSVRIVTQQVANMELVDRLKGALTQKNYVIGNSCNVIHTEDEKVLKMILALINSTFCEFLFRLFSTNNHINIYEIESLPIVRATPDQQAPIISLVDAIIQKKKEYHSISQNIEDYIDFKEAKLSRLDEFLKKTTEGFEILSSLEVKNDNFDALRVRIEGDEIILEYGIKRKIEEYEEIDEEEAEVKGKYVIDWNSAGEGKIKDIEAIEFLSEVLEGIRNFSQAKQKSIWQKIAEVKIPEFNEKVKEGFLKFKSAMKKAKELDGEILRIDRAIDRLVYDLYGLTEEEIQVVEKSVWGDKFEEMYSKLPSRENALKLAGECKNG